jgi:uroporphyrinogen decarboxylase
MPGSGSLGGHVPGVIKDMDDFLKYPWDEISSYYEKKNYKNFELLGEVMPEGMKAIGGPGNGVFELVQDVTGYENLCIFSFEEPELFAGLFEKVGDLMYKIWKAFLDKFADTYAVCRFGDDLGFKSATLLPPDAVRQHIIPQYKRIIDLIHSYNKPFLLHSCGKIFDVMPDLIDVVKIDAKHSNEDQIAPFSEWVDKYGDRIGLFGGVDTDHLCRKSPAEVKEIVKDLVALMSNKNGFALGSGNSIPNYVSPELYLTMVETARECRGE